ncbi:acyl carrier protein [Azospira inquinata]|uniref:Acyl carrier protein n=1 Tax=Azospira inquinata TaxID=2785627 RepID=A0A975SN37_9RHOO|nr:acyl carrier protein [Azospira inquinata]QWT45282.1 acyl carrier protein [Azospira inquinata]QWT49386.1 acyl carrier protein [Azospira inquinata]
MNTLETIKQLAADHFGIDLAGVTPETPFDQLGIDSLALIDFIFELEDAFHITIPPTADEPLTNLAQLTAYVEGLQKKAGA